MNSSSQGGSMAGMAGMLRVTNVKMIAATCR